ncbi:alkaline phosphatase D family protein [Benzoatithermus flavus]|uniref:Alkaline phosphatase D family protein n=1 Tax=Benzoatithermus flavus TaxID=3108223 RepID=A0ABU8XRM1_9PROT
MAPTRRSLMRSGLLLGGGALLTRPFRALAQAPAVITSEKMRPQLPYGVQAGDVVGDRAVIWSRADRPARMLIELSTTESFAHSWKITGPAALEDSDFTAKLDVAGLPPGQRVFYRVTFQDLGDLVTTSTPVTGSFLTPPAVRRHIRFVWGGDVAGQGWGINPDFGGMRMFETMRAVEPDFFIHSGDTVYADGPIFPEVRLPDGSVWKNLVTEAKAKPAETLAEFRGNHAYNLLDENVRRFNAEVPSYVQWDDHEVTNNWYWEKVLGEPTAADLKAGRIYRNERRVSILAPRGLRAFMEYYPIRRNPLSPDQIYTSFRYGPSLEIFRLDERSYRAANSFNRQERPGPDTAFLGATQLRWLKQALLASDATWKVIQSDMPIGLLVPDGKDQDGRPQFEAFANGDGPALGRELEVADLLRFIRDNRIRNTVWLTADVHYAAAHRYDPSRAQFKAFEPFWEFVAGPLNAGTFGPNELDDTFGPEVVFVKAPEKGQANLPPSAGMQFFGQVDIDAESEVMTVSLKDLNGATLFTQELIPVA